jgi:hypothetical protein
MGCSDPRLTYLNSFGYNVVKLPRVGIDPLQVLGRDQNSFEDLGSLSTIWKASNPIPATQGPNVAANVNGQKTDDLKLSVGLDILSSVLQGMGATSPNLGVAYSRARSVQFTFTNVSEYLVMPLDVGSYLSGGDLNTASPFANYFLDHDKQAYVVTSVLKSDSIIVTGKQDSNTVIGLDLPSIKQAVGVNLSVSASGTNGEDITFKGTQALTFGFKVFGITYGDGRWQVYGQAPSGGNALSLMSSHPLSTNLPLLLAPGALITSVPRKGV